LAHSDKQGNPQDTDFMNIASVELLNRSIENMGQSFGQARRETTDANYRQRLLDQEIERQKAAQAHYDQMNQNEQDANKVRAQAQVDKDDQETLSTLTQLNASGALKDRDAVNNWLKAHPKFGKIGLALQEPPQKPPPQVGQNSVAQALRQADAFAAQADAESDPVKKAKYLDSEKILRESARQAAQPKQNAADYDVVTEETAGTPGVPAAPATPGGLFTKGTPAQPAIPPTPKTVIRRHVPRGTVPTAGTATTQDPAALRQQAQQAIAGGKDPTAVRARFKQLTGQDL
jgi:hypothetical protein